MRKPAWAGGFRYLSLVHTMHPPTKNETTSRSHREESGGMSALDSNNPTASHTLRIIKNKSTVCSDRVISPPTGAGLVPWVWSLAKLEDHSHDLP